MGCSASDLDEKQELITTDNYNWSQTSYNDAYIGGKKYIFYKTKYHKRILLLQHWLRVLNISIDIDSKQYLIKIIACYIKYESKDEIEGNKYESLIVETNCILVLPANGERIYEFKSLHIQPFGILTVTKWIDCDYHNNIGGVLKIHCHENIIIDKDGQINLNGAGLTGLENNNILTKYGGWNVNDIEQDEKAIELNIIQTISKPNLYKFENYYLAKGGSYFKINKKKNNIKIKNKIYFGGIGGGSISLRCNNFINNGYVLANCTNKPKKFSKATNDRQMLSKLQYFANDGNQKYTQYTGYNLKVIDLGTNGTGGFISIHIYNNFINYGLIQAMEFGDINIVQLDGVNIDPNRKLIFGEFRKNINPYPKAQGKELKQIPTDELL